MRKALLIMAVLVALLSGAAGGDEQPAPTGPGVDFVGDKVTIPSTIPRTTKPHPVPTTEVPVELIPPVSLENPPPTPEVSAATPAEPVEHLPSVTG